MQWLPLEVSEEAYDAIAAAARRRGMPVDVVADEAVRRALDPGEPAQPWATLYCERCGKVARHRWTGADVIPGGYAYRYRCVPCYKPRHFGLMLLFLPRELDRLYATYIGEIASGAALEVS